MTPLEKISMLVVTFPFQESLQAHQGPVPCPSLEQLWEAITKWPAGASVEADHIFPEPLCNSAYFFLNITPQETFHTRTPDLRISFWKQICSSSTVHRLPPIVAHMRNCLNPSETFAEGILSSSKEEYGEEWDIIVASATLKLWVKTHLLTFTARYRSHPLVPRVAFSFYCLQLRSLNSYMGAHMSCKSPLPSFSPWQPSNQ